VRDHPELNASVPHSLWSSRSTSGPAAPAVRAPASPSWVGSWRAMLAVCVGATRCDQHCLGRNNAARTPTVLPPTSQAAGTLTRTPAPGVEPDDRQRFDFDAYGTTRLGEALCCDVVHAAYPRLRYRKLPSRAMPIRPHAWRSGTALARPQPPAGSLSRCRKPLGKRTYPEFRQSARCKLVELGGRWGIETATFVKLFARLLSFAACPRLRCKPSLLALRRQS